MSTHSHIFYKNECGKYVGVYCHYDGYVSGVGYRLFHYYTDIEKIKNLIALGSIVSLDKDINPAPQYQNISYLNSKPLLFGYCEFFHRDNGEDLTIIETDSLDDYSGYVYLFENNQWYVHMYNEEEERVIRTLKEALFYIQEQRRKEGKKSDLFRTPLTHVIQANFETYCKNIARQFIIGEVNTYCIGDYLLFKAYEDKKHFLLSTQIYDIQEEYGLEKNFRIILFNVPKDIAWYNPINYSSE